MDKWKNGKLVIFWKSGKLENCKSGKVENWKILTVEKWKISTFPL